MAGPEEPAITDMPSSPSEAFALGWSMAWAEKRIMRCPIKDGNYTGDDDPNMPDPCPACGATVSGNDPVNGVCQSAF
jgi:hypothetical protein